MKRPFVVLFGMLMLVSCSQPTTNAESVSVYFPLSKGAYWIYEADVKWTVDQTVMQKQLTWKMEVVDTVQQGDIVGYALKGHPSDLAWYAEGKEPSEYAIVQVGLNKFYQTGIEILDQLRDQADQSSGLVHEDELIFDFPLVSGKSFCPAEQGDRPDSLYCWLVGQETQPMSRHIAGIASPGTLVEYTLRMATLPDHVIIHFVEGIGITRYEYVHHGTVSEVDAWLTEYHPGTTQR